MNISERRTPIFSILVTNLWTRSNRILTIHFIHWKTLACVNKSKAIQDYFLFRKWLLGILSNFMENTCNCQIIACKKVWWNPLFWKGKEEHEKWNSGNFVNLNILHLRSTINLYRLAIGFVQAKTTYFFQNIPIVISVRLWNFKDFCNVVTRFQGFHLIFWNGGAWGLRS